LALPTNSGNFYVNLKTLIMAVLKVIEVLANSSKSWEDAVENAVEQASKSVKHIKSVYINEQSASVTDGKISEYRVNVKITFEVK
jgi:flavin-binding protein dodecin